MPTSLSPPICRRCLLIAALAVAVLGVWVLYRFPPTAGSFYPRCVVHSSTGLYCSGCGTTRALHALLHGRFAEAAHQNVLVVIFLPLIGWALARRAWSAWGDQPVYRLSLRPIWNWTILALFILFAVFRNVPYKPFAWLAPE